MKCQSRGIGRSVPRGAVVHSLNTSVQHNQTPTPTPNIPKGVQVEGSNLGSSRKCCVLEQIEIRLIHILRLYTKLSHRYLYILVQLECFKCLDLKSRSHPASRWSWQSCSPGRRESLQRCQVIGSEWLIAKQKMLKSSISPDIGDNLSRQGLPRTFHTFNNWTIGIFDVWCQKKHHNITLTSISKQQYSFYLRSHPECFAKA